MSQIKKRATHNQRIQILKTADACIKGSKNQTEYKACEVQEKQSRVQLKQKMFQKRKAQILTRLDGKRQCIAQATSHKALKACWKKK